MSLFAGERPSLSGVVIVDDGTTNPLTVTDSSGTAFLTVATGTGAVTSAQNQTVASGKTLAVTTADKLTVGGVIVPQTMTVTTELLAASVDKWVFVAPFACKVVSVKEVHSVAGGSAAAVSPRKITGVSAPGAAVAAGVTEITTAAFDLTATANTVVTGTLSATATDYTLAAGDKIGLDFSGTLTALVGFLVIELKRV